MRQQVKGRKPKQIELFLRMANGIHAPNYYTFLFSFYFFRHFDVAADGDMIVNDLSSCHFTISQKKDGWVFVKPKEESFILHYALE